MPRRAHRGNDHGRVKLRPASADGTRTGVAAIPVRRGRREREFHVARMREDEAARQTRGREAALKRRIVKHVVDEKHSLHPLVLPAQTKVGIPPFVHLSRIGIFEERLVAVGGIEFEVPFRTTAEERMSVTAADDR